MICIDISDAGKPGTEHLLDPYRLTYGIGGAEG